jgi:DNA-directed RNA polymerase sigma subunit (sigma70/sigma32)
MGMAGILHIRKGTEIINNPKLIELYVKSFDAEAEAEDYLKSLPRLVKQTRVQDAHCAELWESRDSLDDPSSLTREQGRLIRLLRRFQFHLRTYERVVRQPDKPQVDEARQRVSEDVEDRDAVRHLESRLRLPLSEFIELEESIAADLRLLDESRSSIVEAYIPFARKKAMALAAPGEDGERFALCGLRKATEYYTYRRGYRFKMYAIHWIEAAIRDKKTWGL